MIGRLHGVLVQKQPPALLLDVHGVGYELEAPMTTFYDLPEVGAEVTLHTHLVVREDAQLLYGFAHARTRNLCRSLLKVNGVGPRVALAVLSGLSHDELLDCLAHEDVARLTHVPGIGRKTAERLIVELRDRVLHAAPEAELEPAAARAAGGARDATSDAVHALVALGYKPQEASRAVQGVAGPGLSSENIIRQALKGLAGLGP